MTVPRWMNTQRPPRLKRSTFAFGFLAVILGVIALIPSPKSPPDGHIQTLPSAEPIPDEVAAKELNALLDVSQQIIAKGVLDTQDREEIYRLFLLRGASDPQKARDAFYLIISARLQQLPPEIAARVRTATEDVMVIDDGFNDGGAYWDNRSHSAQVALSLPEFLQHTIVEYALLLHELEHVAQLELAQSTDPRLLPFMVSDSDSALKFRRERLALTVEWAYLHSIPRETKIALLEGCLRLEEFKNMPGAEIVAADLKDSDLPLEQYLSVAEKMRGYTPPELARAQTASLGPKTSDLSQQIITDDNVSATPTPKPEPRDTDFGPPEE